MKGKKIPFWCLEVVRLISSISVNFTIRGKFSFWGLTDSYVLITSNLKLEARKSLWGRNLMLFRGVCTVKWKLALLPSCVFCISDKFLQVYDCYMIFIQFLSCLNLLDCNQLNYKMFLSNVSLLSALASTFFTLCSVKDPYKLEQLLYSVNIFGQGIVCL